ncbi:hypothetical protein Droror1_Dr00008267 [Drosera rotundifolia]
MSHTVRPPSPPPALPIRMRIKMVVEDLCRVIRFICTVEFWRMTVLWPLSLLLSQYMLFRQMTSSHKSQPYPRSESSKFMINGVKSHVCVITGATSGLGAAAAHALSREGFFVVLA